MKPERIQLKRTRGWRMPPNTVKVDRSSRAFGNPFRVCATGERTEETTAEQAVNLFECYAENRLKMEPEWLKHLMGKNLACWCKPGDPCHADILIRLANG